MTVEHQARIQCEEMAVSRYDTYEKSYRICLTEDPAHCLLTLKYDSHVREIDIETISTLSEEGFKQSVDSFLQEASPHNRWKSTSIMVGREIRCETLPARISYIPLNQENSGFHIVAHDYYRPLIGLVMRNNAALQEKPLIELFNTVEAAFSKVSSL